MELQTVAHRRRDFNTKGRGGSKPSAPPFPPADGAYVRVPKAGTLANAEGTSELWSTAHMTRSGCAQAHTGSRLHQERRHAHLIVCTLHML